MKLETFFCPNFLMRNRNAHHKNKLTAISSLIVEIKSRRTAMAEIGLYLVVIISVIGILISFTVHK